MNWLFGLRALWMYEPLFNIELAILPATFDPWLLKAVPDVPDPAKKFICSFPPVIKQYSFFLGFFFEFVFHLYFQLFIEIVDHNLELLRYVELLFVVAIYLFLFGDYLFVLISERIWYFIHLAGGLLLGGWITVHSSVLGLFVLLELIEEPSLNMV